MGLNEKQQVLLKRLPGVDIILGHTQEDKIFDTTPKRVIVKSIRKVLEHLRASIINRRDMNPEIQIESDVLEVVLEKVKSDVKDAMTPNLLHTINATGVVVHTNLGRSLLPQEAFENIAKISSRYSNLEFDLLNGIRGSRYSCVEDILCEISGAEAAMVVNNNAAAVLLCLETIAKGKEVIVSRGELVEIGGSFRVPDVMVKSGCILNEVGTTNRTHPRDYENAINNDTGLLLKVHTSNYSVVGFTSDVPLKDLVNIGEKYHLPVMEDLGSGTFIDFSKYGLPKEPTVQESVASGADIISFSGDKLLGGPQGGLIVGKKKIIEKIKQNPITRALRIDKLTLAALESTLRLYLDEEKAVNVIPTLRMLTMPLTVIEEKAKKLKKMLMSLNDSRLHIDLADFSSRAGGGSLPLLDLPSKCVKIIIDGISVNTIEKEMRKNSPPVIGRIEYDFFIMDLRTIFDDELIIIKNAIDNMLKKA